MFNVADIKASLHNEESGGAKNTEPANTELVVYRSQDIELDYLFDNRWKDNKLIDYNAVEVWDDSRLQMDHTGLLRIKILHLLRNQITGLLNWLSGGPLEVLEIDTLELLEASKTEYTFSELKLLSIDAIFAVDRKGLPAAQREMGPPWPTIKFIADKLETVDLGK